jgi:aryl-alcohol dehydrogenase-like predicted oxidoreductase
MNQPGKKALALLGRRQNFDGAAIERRIDASLRRLRRDVIDIYYLHEPPVAAIHNEELMNVLRKAVIAGKIRYLGVSGDSLPVLDAATKVTDFSVVQTRLGQDYGRGSLSGDRGGPAIILNQVLTSAPPSLVSAAERRVAERGLSRSGVLLRHAAVPAAVRVVLVGTSQPDHLRANAKAFQDQITDADLLL